MIARGIAPRGRRVRVLALQTSAMLGALLVAEPAFAACAPDPSVANSTIHCTDTDSDGLTVANPNTHVVVSPGAVVRPGNGLAAILSRSTNASFQIAGLVDGGTDKPGLFITTEPPSTTPCDPYIYCLPGSGGASISVQAGGRVVGAQGILIRRDQGSNGDLSVMLDNAGTITGSAGPAVVAGQMGFGALGVNNATTGVIGGIEGPISYLINAGTIDGGSNSAIASTYQGLAYRVTDINNRGRILSSGQSTTLSSTGSLSVTNSLGAVIGGGTTAIHTGGALALANFGTINGSVVSTAGSGQGSTIDTRSGTINGDILLGAGDDMG